MSGGGVYEYGADVTISATPKQGYRFLRWTETLSLFNLQKSAETTVKIPNAPVTIEPVFKIIPVKVTATVTGNGKMNGLGEYNPNQKLSQ